MTSSIVNYIIENYLSNIFEINPEQTKASLWEGTVELNNIKFKKNIFTSLNLPYIELDEGFIGYLKITLQLPRFYLYPIKLNIDKVFIFAKQKSVNKINKKDEIKIMEEYKKNKLKTIEELLLKIKELNKETPGIQKQIFDNLQINIKNLVFIFEDSVSYLKHPFKFGIICEEISFNSTDENFNIKENENLKENEIKYKLSKIENFSIFLDYYDHINEFNIENKIVKSEEEKINKEIKNFLKEKYKLYAYCLSEINVHNKKKDSHYYILYNLNMISKLIINNNYKENNLSQFSLEIDFNEINNCIKIKQIKAIAKELNYINLKNLYQQGLEKEIYKQNLTEKEIAEYIDLYINYYKTKYIDIYKNEDENKKFLNNLNEIESKLSFNQIQNMRELSNIKIKYIISIGEVDKKIKDVNDAWYFISSREDDIKKLKEEREKILKIEKEKSNKDSLINQLLNIEKKNVENINNKNEENDYKLFNLKFNMKKLILNVEEINKKNLMELNVTNFVIESKINLISKYFYFCLEDFNLKQYCTKNINYQNAIYTKNNNENNNNNNNIINIIFEINPKFEKSDYKLIIKGEKQLVILYDNYYLGYIQYKLLKHFNNFDFDELSSFTGEEISKYINYGYSYFLNKNNKLMNFNIDLNINLNSPIILIPKDFLNERNNEIFFINSGNIEINSELLERKKNNIDYSIIKTNENMYCKYIINLTKMIVKKIDDYNMENFKENENDFKIINESFIKINVNNIIDYNNVYLDRIIVDVDISNIKMELNEETIVFLITLYENYLKKNMLLEKINVKNKEIKGDINNNNDLNENNIINNNLNYENESKEKNIQTEEINTNSNVSNNNLINDNKNLITMKINFGLIEFNIYKSLTLSEEKLKNENNLNIPSQKDFLQFYMNHTFFEIKIKNNGIIDSFYNFGFIFLYDKDTFIDNKTLNKNYYINKEFECILGTSIENKEKINKNKIKFSDLLNNENSNENNNNYSIKIQYKYLPKTKEIFIDMNIEKIFFSPNFDSLKRIYQFIMFYTKIYFNSQNLLLGEELKELLENYDKKIEMNEFEKENNINNNNSNDKILFKNFSTLLKFKNVLSKKVKSKSKRIITVNKTENSESTLKLNCKINSLDFVIPINPKLNNTYILYMSAYFSMFNSIYSKWEIQFHYYQILNFNFKDYLYEFNFELLKGKMNMFKFQENYILFNKVNDVDLDNITKSFEMKFKMFTNLDFNNEYYVNKIDLNCGKLNFVMNLGNFISFYDLYLNSMNFVYEYKNEYESVLTKNLFDKNNINIENVIISNIQNSINIKTINNSNNNNNSKNSYTTNIDNFSNFIECSFNQKSVSIKLYDYFKGSFRKILSINLKEMSCVYLSNSDPKDATNFSNALIEMISGINFPIEIYDIKQLFQYCLFKFNFEINYFNLYLNQWESFLEPFSINIYLIQVLKRMRKRLEINSNEKMINFNLSCNVLKILKIVIEKYKKILNEKNDNKENIENNIKIKGFEENNIIIRFKNKTGENILFWFDNKKNSKQFELKNKNCKEFTLEDINNENIDYKEINNHFNTTFSFKINDKIIKYNNINYSDVQFHRINIENDFFDLKIKSYINDNLIRIISFNSNILIKNKSEIDLIINNDKNNENIIINKHNNIYIPINWFKFKDSIKIFVQFNNEKKLLFRNLNDIFSINSFVSFENGENLSFDIIELESINNINIKSYKIIINSPISLFNKTPYDMKINNFVLKSLSNNNLYKNINITNSDNVIKTILENKLKIFYKNNNKIEELTINKYKKSIENTNCYNVSFSNNNGSLICKFLNYNEYNLSLFENKLFNISKYKQNNIKIIIYFDYFFVNKTESNIFIQNVLNENKENIDNNKNLSVKINIEPNSFIPVSSFLMNNEVKLNLNSTEESESFKLNTIGANFTLNLKHKFKNNLIPLGINIQSSFKYSFSQYIVIENRYKIINKLGFDINLKEFNNENNIFNIKNNEIINVLLSNEKNRLFKIGFNNEFSSNIIDLDNIGQFDLKIKVNKSLINDKEILKKLFTYNKKDYYLPFTCFIQSYDNCVVYCLFTFNKHSLIEIDNKTNYNIKISFVGDKNNIDNIDNNNINIQPNKIVPLITKDIKIINKINVNINNKNITISLNKFSKNYLTIDKETIIKFQLEPMNGNLTKNLIINAINTNNNINKLISYENTNFMKSFTKYFGMKYFFNLKGIGFSLIDQEPKEILYISLYKINFNYNYIMKYLIDNSENIKEEFIFNIYNIQIDYCLDNSFKVIMSPKTQILPENEAEIVIQNYGENLIPFLQFLVIKRTNINNIDDNFNEKEINIYYQRIEIILQEITMKIDHVVINQLINLINEYLISFGLILSSDKNNNETEKRENEEEEEIFSKIELEKLFSDFSQISSYAIKHLSISVIKLNISFRFDKNSMNNLITKSYLGFLINILKMFSTSLISFSDTPFKFKEINIDNIYNNLSYITNELIENYKLDALSQFYKIIFGIDLIGNPIKLLNNIGMGFYELFNEPRKGFIKGKFGKGVIKGFSSLFSNVIGGAFNSIYKISDSLYNTTKLISNSSENNNDNNFYDTEENLPNNCLEGVWKGMKLFFIEIYEGCFGVCIKPYRQSREEGVIGFFKGCGNGIAGAVLCPFSSIFILTGNISKGIVNSIGYDKYLNKRFREPRILCEYMPILPYDKMIKSNKIVKEFIYNNKNNHVVDNLDLSVKNKKIGLENSSKIVFCEFFNNNKNFIIISDVIIVILDGNIDKIVEKIYIDNIKNVKINENKIFILLKDENEVVLNIEDKKIVDKIFNILNDKNMK